MRAITRSSGAAAGLAVVAWASSVIADPSVVKLEPYLNVSFENKDKDLELGPELSVSESTHRVQVLARVPFESDSKPSTVQLTKSTGRWRLVGAYKLDLDTTGETGSASYWRLGVRVEWGAERFKYTPIGGEKKEGLEHSGAGEVGALWFFGTADRGASVQLAPQLLARYDRAYKAADKVSLVSLSGTDPAIVEEATVAPPTATPGLTLRLAAPIYFGALGQPFAFGPAFASTFTGGDGDMLGCDAIRLRWEAWIYYFPVSKGITNLRMGAAAFGSHRVKGKDKVDHDVLGALLQLRLATTLLDY